MDMKEEKEYMIKGMILDLDGTTLDTLNDLYESFNKALKQFDLPAKTKEEIRMGVGSGAKVLIERCTPEGTDNKTREEMGKAYWKIYSENYLNTTVPYEGMHEVLRTLQDKGIKLAINSNKGDGVVKNLIAKNFPDIDFVEVMGEREGIVHKPDPQGPLMILDKMGLKNEEVVYVGDSDVDIYTAKNSGFRSIGCLWGFRDEKTLKEAGADLIVSKPEEILKYVEEDNR